MLYFYVCWRFLRLCIDEDICSILTWLFRDLFYKKSYISTNFDFQNRLVTIELLYRIICSGYLTPILTYFLKFIHHLPKSSYNL